MTRDRGDSLDGEVASVTFDEGDDSVVVIVGSGAGGGTLANELAQIGIDVVVLEAGRRYGLADYENDEWAMAEKLGWDGKRTCTGNCGTARSFPDSPTDMCKGVGGTTLHWSAMAPRLQAHDFKTRSIYGAIPGANIADWPIGLDDLAPYYDRAEDKMGVTGTNGIPRPPPSNNFKVMAAGARRIGYTRIDTNNLAMNMLPRDGRNACDVISFCMQGCKSGALWTTANTEIPRAEATGRCEVRPECMALQIHHDARGRARGVVYADADGNHRLQKARIVCVAGNAVETPRLLFNSASSLFPDGLANHSGAVGRNYLRHINVLTCADFERPVSMHRGVTVAGVIHDEVGHDPSRGFAGGLYLCTYAFGLPFFAAFLTPAAWGRAYAERIATYGHTAVLGAQGEDLAVATNRVSLHPTEHDQFGLPIPHLHVDDHPNDFALANYGLKKAAEIFDAVGAQSTFDSTDYPFSHNMGTCRMSEDPTNGVVDRWGRAHDVPNLFVSDGSQFPSSGAANPTLTIVALAIRQAKYMGERMGRNEI